MNGTMNTGGRDRDSRSVPARHTPFKHRDKVRHTLQQHRLLLSFALHFLGLTLALNYCTV